MPHYTSPHWGLREIVEGPCGLALRAVAGDPHRNPIGLDQLSPEVQAQRERRPAVRPGRTNNQNQS